MSSTKVTVTTELKDLCLNWRMSLLLAVQGEEFCSHAHSPCESVRGPENKICSVDQSVCLTYLCFDLGELVSFFFFF